MRIRANTRVRERAHDTFIFGLMYGLIGLRAGPGWPRMGSTVLSTSPRSAPREHRAQA
ncbi:enterochelin esterase-like enzyme [Kitasatospora sp. MAP12-15]|nr:enterochelin esterase-like enzyme [Kitasatospora sp. MAP12-44]